MRPETKLQFDKACDALGLEPERREKAWRRMTDLGLTPDDPTTIFLAVAGVLEKATDTLPKALAAMPARVEEAAKRAVGPVANAAKAEVERAHAKLAENTGAAVAASVEIYFDERLKMRRFTVSATVAGLAVLLLLLTLFLGYQLGRWNVAGLGTEIAALASRADITDWLRLMAGNSDLSSALASYCAPGSDRSMVVQGVRACSVPLWIDGSAAPAPGGPVVGVYSSVMSFLNGYHPAVLVGGGLLAGLVLRKLLKMAGSIPGVRWLTN